MVALRAKVTGFGPLSAQTKAVKRRLERGDLNVAAALRFFDVVSNKFDNEGPGWALLSEMRIERRKGSEHPILDWKGDLRKAATSWTEQHDLKKVRMDRYGNSREMEWRLSGAKVENHFGSTRNFVRPKGPVVSLTEPITTTRNLPPRPFWPMDSEWGPTADKMLEPLELFLDGWASGDLGAFDAELKQSKNRKRTR